MPEQSHAQSSSAMKPEATPSLEHVSQGVLVSQLSPEKPSVHTHEQASTAESPAATPPFWHAEPSAPTVHGQVPQTGFVPAPRASS